jgi:hypothetical protein
MFRHQRQQLLLMTAMFRHQRQQLLLMTDG